MDKELVIGEDALQSIADSHSSLVVTHGGSIQGVISSIVKYFVDRGYSGIYLSLNKPHKTVEKILKREGVKLKKLYYIDCITASIHNVDKDAVDSVVYLDHPEDLSQKEKIMDAIDKFAFSVPEDKFLIVDALRTILLYHEPEIVSHLIENLIRELQDINIKFIVLTGSEEDKSVIEAISYHFDSVIEI